MNDASELRRKAEQIDRELDAHIAATRRENNRALDVALWVMVGFAIGAIGLGAWLA